MTYILDTQNDEYYNEKYLNKTDSEWIAGFDEAALQAECFFDNLDVFYDTVGTIDGINILEFLDEHEELKEKLVESIGSWLHMERDEFITSMIDNMSDEEYEEIKARVDEGE